MLPMTQCDNAHRDIGNEKISFNPLPGKAWTEHRSNSENLQAV